MSYTQLLRQVVITTYDESTFTLNDTASDMLASRALSDFESYRTMVFVYNGDLTKVPFEAVDNIVITTSTTSVDDRTDPYCQEVTCDGGDEGGEGGDEEIAVYLTASGCPDFNEMTEFGVSDGSNESALAFTQALYNYLEEHLIDTEGSNWYSTDVEVYQYNSSTGEYELASNGFSRLKEGQNSDIWRFSGTDDSFMNVPNDTIYTCGYEG